MAVSISSRSNGSRSNGSGPIVSKLLTNDPVGSIGTYREPPATPVNLIPADLFDLHPGRVTGLVGAAGTGLTRLALSMLASSVKRGPIVYLDARGWFSPAAAFEVGILPQDLVVVRCGDPVGWAQVAATLVEGVSALYAEVPRGVKDAQLRKLGAMVRSARTPVVLRPLHGDLPGGVAHLRLVARAVEWEGTDRGHGRLGHRRVVLEASGKATRGMTRVIEMEDDGANALHVVSGLAAAPSGRAAG